MALLNSIADGLDTGRLPSLPMPARLQQELGLRPEHSPGKIAQPSMWDRLKAQWKIPAFRLTVQVLAPACVAALILLPLWFASRYGGERWQQQLTIAQSNLKDERLKRQSAENKLTALEKKRQELARDIEQLKLQARASQYAAIGHGLVRDSKGSLFFAESVHKEDTSWMVAAVTEGKVDIPTRIKDWSQGSHLLGGDTPKPHSVEMLSPVNTLVLSKRPLFRWKTLRPGRYYRLVLQSEARDPVATTLLNSEQDGRWEVKVYGKDTSKLLDSYKTKSGTEWDPVKTDKLPTMELGRGYRWWVEELDKSGVDARVIGEASRVALFEVAGPASELPIKHAQSQFASNHLLLGAYYARNGFIEDARRELKLEPDKKSAARLLKNLPPER